ncbi:MAG: ATP-binding protein [Marichromatium sp.]|nr:ATP-binding protein [Marichromatium sp.]
MSLINRTPRCPTHDCPLELVLQGEKRLPGHPLIEAVGVPMYDCPRCREQGEPYTIEAEPAATNALIKRLGRTLARSRFPGALLRPKVRIDFNPWQATLARRAHANPEGAPIDPEIARAAGLTPEPEALAESSATEPAAPEAASAAPTVTPRLDWITPERPRHRLDQLILDPETLTRIREATNVLLAQGLIYDTWNLAAVARTGRRLALNFYGPPGTGKTLAADAIADLLDRPILRVSYAELESMYVGETPKNIQAAFARARESGALLFFDEADSILGRRLRDISQSADNSINVARSTTLIELDNFEGAVIFASNLVGNYDTAFLRRMLAHVEFRLPGPDERARLWAAHIPAELPLAADVDHQDLAAHSEGAAGGDIQNAVLLAASYAAMRPESEQRVAQADLQRAIDFLLEGKRRILEDAPPAHPDSCEIGFERG